MSALPVPNAGRTAGRPACAFRPSVWPVLCAVMALIPILVASGQVKTGAPASVVFDPARHVRADNGAIAVVVERASGQYWIESGNGAPLLFTNAGGATSFSNVRIGDATFTNNRLRSARTSANTAPLPGGTANAANGRVEFRTAVPVRDGIITLQQEFTPLLETDYAFVRIRTTIRNSSSFPVRAGLLIMLDAFIDGADGIDIAVDGQAIAREREWMGVDVPAEWSGTAPGKGLTVRGRLSGQGTDAPDQFVVGRWQYDGYLGAASWDYHPSGLRFHDNAVLMQWNQRVVAPGDSLTVTTDYGYRGDMQLDLSCRADEIVLSVDSTGYSPNPFSVRAAIHNSGFFPIPGATVRITPPASVLLAPGEPIEKRSGTIQPGDSAVLTWQIYPADLQHPAILPFSFQVIDPPALGAQCTVDARTPGLPVRDAALSCGDTVRLGISGGGSKYVPDPFPITATVLNTGTVPLFSAQATLLLPPGLEHAGPSTVAVTPSPLGVGLSGTATWTARAKRRTTSAVLSYSITLEAYKTAQRVCAGFVAVPGLPQQPPCSENGVNTRGTEFWLAFPRNPYGDSVNVLSLYIAAVDSTVVRIERPSLGMADDLAIAAGEIARFDVENGLDTHTPEIVERHGIHITSGRPVSVIGANLNTAHSDAFLALPMHALGTEYLTVGYNFDDPSEQFLVCAPEDATTVTIDAASFTSTRRAPHSPWTVTLGKGETYMVLAGSNGPFGSLSGSLITADKPVAVYSGSVSGWIPANGRTFYGYLNPHFEQLVPLRMLGKKYVAIPFRARGGGDTYKAVAAEDSLDLVIGGAAPVRLDRKGNTHEFILTEPAEISGTRPFLLAQFAHSATWESDSNEFGDASMTLLVPVSRFMTCHAFSSGLGDRFDSSYVNLVIADGMQYGVLLDGRAAPDTAFHPVPGAPYRYARIPLGRGSHTLETSDSRGIGGISYGFEYHDAFSYPTGFLTGAMPGLTGRTGIAVHSPAVVSAPYPNPAVSSARVDVTLVRPERLRVDVYDALGRHVRSIREGAFGPGRHSIILPFEDSAPGVYEVRIQIADAVISRTVAVQPGQR